MNVSELLLAQVEREIPTTRTVVERVPDGKADWKPHPKSMPLGYLSALVAGMFGWIAMMIESDHLDLAGGGGAPSASNAGERAALFDKSVASARNGLKNATDEHLMQPWQLRVGGKVVDEKPRYMMIADTIRTSPTIAASSRFTCA
jgi:hypothetical protein